MPVPPDDAVTPQHANECQSLDNPDEVFDLVDLDDRVIGQVRRGDAHRNPALIHRSVQILVFASDGRLLLQRRSVTKDLFPSYYCASASGHVASGENYEDTAQRELVEELGITAPLTYIGKALIQSEPETEITALYATISDGPYQFHPTETEGGSLFALREVWDGVAVGNLPITPALRVALDELMRLTGQSEAGIVGFLSNLG
jgi:isopentenyldiphosphate isomerase